MVLDDRAPKPTSPKLQNRNNVTHASPQDGPDMKAFSFLRPMPWLTLALAATLAPMVPGQDVSTGTSLPDVDPQPGLPTQISNPAPVDPTTGQPIQGLPKSLTDLNPIPSWSALLATAKAAEEGDADLTAASDQYVTIVRIFDQLRPIAAEALYRYARIEDKREHGDEAQVALARLIQWFPDFHEYAKKSLEARGATSGKTSTSASSTGSPSASNPPLSPDLMRRYGLTPATEAAEPSGAPTPSTMSPEMMKRYGLRSAPVTPTTTTANPSLPRDVRLAELRDRRSEVVAESARTAADCRKARLELKRVEGLQARDIPPNLVSDQRFRALLEGVPDGLTGLPEEQIKKLIDASHVRIIEYFEATYKPRLLHTVDILSRELQELRSETTEIDLGISKLQPRF